MDELAARTTSPLQQFGLAINFFFPALAFIVLALRLYGKAAARSQGPGTFRHPSTLLGPDDVFACLAMLISIGLTIGSYYWIKTNYVGIDRDNIPPFNPRVAFIWTYVVHILYYPTMALVKSAVLIFLLRLGGHTRRLRVVIHSLNIINLAFMVAVLVGSVVQCRPIPFMWDKSIPGGTCFNQAAFYLIQSGLNLVTDAFTLGLPIWVFRYSTTMGRRMKLATLYVFLLGFIVTLVGIARFVFLYLLFYSNAVECLEYYTMSFCLSAVETNLGIVCACAPTLRGLIRTWFPRALNANANLNETDDPFTDAKSSSAAGTRDSGVQGKPGFNTSEYEKDGRGRVLCSHAAVGGLGLTPSEEDIMRSNGVLRTTDRVVDPADVCSLRTDSTIGDQRDRRGSGGSY
ncbi:cfem domain-containing protein [Podospora aff. communis PSN243]|uniref:Cfem domain-containing protein n=1 Tax=Podospora aff. communis PSN243 TaxID=3040156 RepID=A0AAV9GZ89_9PEZI|nr:cfem domain-containing protein [Podospora aff. communis PSN243]